MERQFQLNWQVIIEAAIAQRKQQGLTQQQLATLVGVSTPTVIRFEKQQKNITLKSAFAILTFFGLMR